MSLTNNSHTDPIVEILQLAYRRGLAVRQEQVKQSSVTQAKKPGKENITKEEPVLAGSHSRDERLPFNHQATSVENSNDG